MKYPEEQLRRLVLWDQIHKQIAALKAQEENLRRQIFGEFFPSPKEGTNTAELDRGYKLKGKHVINRNVDESALSPVLEQLPEGSGDSLIKYKPELKIKAYRALPKDHRNIFDEALIIKPGMPQLEISAPPKSKRRS